MRAMTRVLAAVLVLQALVISAAFAEEEAQTSWLSRGKQYGTWWKQSARVMDPMPDQVLGHVTGTVSYTRLNGNVDADIYRGGLTLFLRQRLVTSTTSFTANSTDQKVNVTAKAATVEKYTIHEAIGYDLTNRLAAGSGLMWERDNSILLDGRVTAYMGGRYAVTVKPPVLLKLGAYVGFEDDSYDVGEMQSSFGDELFAAAGTTIPSGYSSTGLRLMDHAIIPLSPKVALVQTFDYMLYFKDTDYYHWQAALTLQAGLVDGVTLTVRYQARYENNLLAERVQQVFRSDVFRGLGRANDLVNRDDVFYTGLKFDL